jgi:hypothetical protein
MMRNVYKILVRKSGGKDHWGDLGICGRMIILKHIFKEI